MVDKSRIIWHDRKRNGLGLPWTFTVYDLSEDRLFVTTGILNKREDEVRLYRVVDTTLTRSLWQRIIGTGTIHLDTADKTMKNFDITNVKNANDVKEELAQLVEKARQAGRVYARESVDTPHDHPGDGPDFDGGPVDDRDDDDDDDNH